MRDTYALRYTNDLAGSLEATGTFDEVVSKFVEHFIKLVDGERLPSLAAGEPAAYPSDDEMRAMMIPDLMYIGEQHDWCSHEVLTIMKGSNIIYHYDSGPRRA